MNDTDKTLEEWSKQVHEHQTATWDALPEIYLYMDQVITYMEKQLSLLGRDKDSALLTSSMINNYVKDGVLPRPDKKKYSREHLAMLTVICMLKPVLSIQDISQLLHADSRDSFPQEMYEDFRLAGEEELNRVSERAAQAAEQGTEQLLALAATLAIEASARRTAAERVLNEISRMEKQKKDGDPT